MEVLLVLCPRVGGKPLKKHATILGFLNCDPQGVEHALFILIHCSLNQTSLKNSMGFAAAAPTKNT